MADDCELGGPSPAKLDAAFLSASCDDIQSVLDCAKFQVSYLRRDISSLATEPELPPAYQALYGRMVSMLASVELAIKAGEKECLALLSEAHSLGRCHGNRLDGGGEQPSPALVAAAREVIDQINQAEIRLNTAIKTAKAALLEHADQGVIDWAMPYNCEFAVLMTPPPSRRFYETCCGGEEPMRIMIQPARDFSDDQDFNDASENWNIFSNTENHPLKHGRHGYLVHCLLDHHLFPWQLLPHIQEIEVMIDFHDCETAWAPGGSRTD